MTQNVQIRRFENESGSSDFEKEKVLCPVCQVVGFPLHRCPHIVVHMNFHSALFVYQNSQGNGILHHLLKVVFSLKEPKVLLRKRELVAAAAMAE